MSLNKENALILQALQVSNEPLSIGQIEAALTISINKKTLQRRLIQLIDAGLVFKDGERRNTKYCLNRDNTSELLGQLQEDKADYQVNEHPIYSQAALSLLNYLETPSYARMKSSYNSQLLNDYIPNQTQYVPDEMREKLLSLGKRFDNRLAAGTYAKNIEQRLLIDLSYNSSRLEGNTYSKLDTERLIENGLTADGKIHEETVMILNHKEAILLLVENAEEIELNSFTIRNLHYLLSQDLLSNPEACGNVRQIEVTIGKSAYQPLSNPHQLREYLDILLRKAGQIIDPFEQSFFLLLHLSYLQAFEDVNKRTSRLACNIPFIKDNLCPLSFIDVPNEDYFKALLYFYEKNDPQPALELFQWAYSRSCQQYEVVKASLGEIDTYRIQYRNERKQAMGEVIRQQLHGKAIEDFLTQFCIDNSIDSSDKFIVMTENDLKQLHSGAIIGLGITKNMFDEWKHSNDSFVCR
ncbi:MAG: Fic family protein [Parashewanella sp.]